MGFIDCIQGHIDGNRISKQKGRELQNQFDALKKQYTDSGQDAGAAAKAANDIIAVEAQKSAQRRQNILTQAQKIAEVMDEFDAMDGPITKKISDFFQRTYYRAQQIEASMLKHLNDVSKHLAPSFFETSRDYAAIKKGIRSILEGNAEGDDVGRAFKQVFDTIHSRYKAAGGIIGKLENYFPQMHSKDLVRQTSADEWVDFISPLLNREKMIDPATSMPFTDARLREVLLESHERIVTNGASDLKKRLKSGEAMTQGRKTDLDERRDVSRFLHFKDADSFFEYNNRFGVGDEGLPGALLGHIRGMSKDLAVMETMGPKSDSMMKRFEDGMRAEGITGVKAGWVKGQYQVVKGFNGGSVENKPWMMILSGVQNWLRSAMLGAASISAISDSAFIAATSKINGLSTTRAMNNYLKLMGGNKNLKDIAKRSGFIADVVNGSVIADARLATTMHEGGKAQGRGANFANAAAKFQNMTGWLAGLTNKFSGLARMTQATQDAIAIEGMATLADNFGRAFGDLDSDLSRNLKQFGISPEDWEIIRKTQALDSGRGAKFFNTDDLRVREDLDPREAAKLANKVDDWIISLRSLASNEGNVRTKAVTSGAFLGNAGRGTGARALGTSFFMFKTFPISVMMNHMIPAFKRGKELGKWDHMMMTTIGAGAIGGMAIQLKEISKGKQPKEVNAKFAMAALSQGGGFGLFGDLILGDHTRFGKSPVASILGGPFVGAVEDGFRLIEGNTQKYLDGRDVNFKKEAFRTAKRYTPLGSLWYSRLAMERLMMDNLERMADPKFDSRMRKYEKKMRKNHNQEFWWAPGEQPKPEKIVGD